MNGKIKILKSRLLSYGFNMLVFHSSMQHNVVDQQQ